MAKKSNLDKLIDAGILKKKHGLNEAEVDAVNAHDSGDIATLVKIHKKWSGPKAPGRPKSLGIVA